MALFVSFKFKIAPFLGIKMDQFKNVHEFDGQLRNIFNPQLVVDKEDEFLEAAKRVHELLESEEAKQCFRMIAFTQDAQNFDSANQTHARLLLLVICSLIQTHVEKKDLISVLSEQLRDCWMLGQCPSGRVTRLIQVYRLLENPTAKPTLDTTVEQPPLGTKENDPAVQASN